MKLILNEEEKEWIKYVGHLILGSHVFVGDFEIVKPYYVVMRNSKIIIKDSNKEG